MKRNGKNIRRIIRKSKLQKLHKYKNANIKQGKIVENKYKFYEVLYYKLLKIIIPSSWVNKSYNNCFGTVQGVKVPKQFEYKDNFIILCIKTVFIYLSIVFLFLYCFVVFFTFPIKKFNFQMANYTISQYVINILDFMHLENTSITYGLRNIYISQYKKIHDKNDYNVYNYIGAFSYLLDDFDFLSYKHNKSKIINDYNYEIYKQKILKEMKQVIEEYPIRNITINNFTGFNGGRGRHLPNRITFYPKLAYLYYVYANIENWETNEENLQTLKRILFSFDEIVTQEKQRNTKNYKNFKKYMQIYHKYDFDQKTFNTYYPRFLYNYIVKIIFMENELHSETFCSNIKLFEKYYSLKENYNNTNSIKVNNILTNKCGILQ